jgi:hypothetical protein
MIKNRRKHMKIETLSIIVKDWRKLRAELKKELTKDK